MSSGERATQLVNVVRNAVSQAGRELGSSAVDEDFQIALSTTRAALRRPTGNTQCLVASVMTYSVGTVIWRRWTNVV